MVDQLINTKNNTGESITNSQVSSLTQQIAALGAGLKTTDALVGNLFTKVTGLQRIVRNLGTFASNPAIETACADAVDNAPVQIFIAESPNSGVICLSLVGRVGEYGGWYQWIYMNNLFTYRTIEKNADGSHTVNPWVTA